MKLPSVPIQTDYVKFGGGIDLATPVLSLSPGAALGAQNYEPGVFGGFTRIDGYERVDGQPSPSDGVYFYATVSSLAQLSVGLSVQGATSGASAVIAYLDADHTAIALAMVEGTFQNGEGLQAGGGSLPMLLIALNYTKTTVATLSMKPVENGAPSGLLDATMLAAAADIYRATIKPPPGSGPCRGVAIYNGIRYNWRDSLDGTFLGMWQSSPGGWAPVYLGMELTFSAGGHADFPEDGDTIVGVVSGATATIARVVLEDGAFDGGDATGRFIIQSQTGTFQGELITLNGSASSISLAGPAVQITLLPGGAVLTENHNFDAQLDTFRMYGCDSVNRGFEFDGVVYVPINTGMDEDAPTKLMIHKEQLFYSFRGSSQNSPPGLPYSWDPVLGADEIGVGDTITGYAVLSGDAAGIFARNGWKQLLGSTIDDFVLKTGSAKEGAIPDTVQTLSDTYYFDDPGIRRVTPSQGYGNFNNQTLSQGVQPIINTLRSKVVTSAVYRMRGQYRVYGSDGSGLIMGVKAATSAFGTSYNQVIGITTFQYPINVTCACSGEDADGKDVVFFGDDQGYVYQGDKGSSFDGQEIEAYLVLPFNNLKTPRLRKRFRHIQQEMSAVGYASLRFQPVFNYGNTNVASHPFTWSSVQGAGGYWDVSDWGKFYWDAPVVSTPEFDVNGTGINMGLIYYSKSAIDLGHTLQGVVIHYTPRRLQRGT